MQPRVGQALQDLDIGFPLWEISFVSLGHKPNALFLYLYHDYRLRQKKDGKQRAEHFSSSHSNPSFLPVLRLIKSSTLAYIYIYQRIDHQIQFSSSYLPKSPPPNMHSDNYELYSRLGRTETFS